MPWRRPKYTEEEKQTIVNGILALRSAGRFQGVWYTHDKLHVRYESWGDPEYLPWWEAAAMLGMRSKEETPARRRKGKPPRSSTKDLLLPALRFVPTLRKRRIA